MSEEQVTEQAEAEPVDNPDEAVDNSPEVDVQSQYDELRFAVQQHLGADVDIDDWLTEVVVYNRHGERAYRAPEVEQPKAKPRRQTAAPVNKPVVPVAKMTAEQVMENHYKLVGIK